MSTLPVCSWAERDIASPNCFRRAACVSKLFLSRGTRENARACELLALSGDGLRRQAEIDELALNFDGANQCPEVRWTELAGLGTGERIQFAGDGCVLIIMHDDLHLHLVDATLHANRVEILERRILRVA